jgi:TolB protein
MKRASNCRTTVVWFGTVVGILVGGLAAKAEIIMSEPVNVGPIINDARDVRECDFSHDGLELYYAANNRPGGYGGYDLWISKRETPNSPWQEPVNLGPNVNSSGREVEPSISGDGLELYFASLDDSYTRVCRRASEDAPWGSPTTLIELGKAWRPDISFDGLTLYIESDRGGGCGGADIWVATRATKADPWGELAALGPNVNSSGNEYCPSISTDGFTLVFMREYTSMWATMRKSINDDWGPPCEPHQSD